MYLLYWKGIATNVGITLGAIMATIMAANVWFVIWPNQKKVIAGAPDAAEAGLSRTCIQNQYFIFYSYALFNGLFRTRGSLPNQLLIGNQLTGLWVGLAIIAVIELNALFGKMNPMITSVKAVVHSGLALGVVFALIVNYL